MLRPCSARPATFREKVLTDHQETKSRDINPWLVLNDTSCSDHSSQTTLTKPTQPSREYCVFGDTPMRGARLPLVISYPCVLDTLYVPRLCLSCANFSCVLSAKALSSPAPSFSPLNFVVTSLLFYRRVHLFQRASARGLSARLEILVVPAVLVFSLPTDASPQVAPLNVYPLAHWKATSMKQRITAAFESNDESTQPRKKEP